jgi:hypothetical protein
MDPPRWVDLTARRLSHTIVLDYARHLVLVEGPQPSETAGPKRVAATPIAAPLAIGYHPPMSSTPTAALPKPATTPPVPPPPLGSSAALQPTRAVCPA